MGGGCSRPADNIRPVTRHYRDDTLVLETDYRTSDGAVTVIDCMPPRTESPNLLRMVVGRRGRVAMKMQLVIRFDYGSIVPWVAQIRGGISAVAGPDCLLLRAGVPLPGENLTTVADFSISAGQHIPFVLTWHPYHRVVPARDKCRRCPVHAKERES